jgi:MFS family permease
VPFNLAVVVGSFFGSRLTSGMGARISAASGLFAIAVGVSLLARLAPEGGYLGILLPGFVLMSLGVGLSAVASTTAGTSALGGEKRGLASGLLNASAEVGYVLSLALLIPFRLPGQTRWRGVSRNLRTPPRRGVQVGVLRRCGAGRARRSGGRGPDSRQSVRRPGTVPHELRAKEATKRSGEGRIE